jgi:hypothetical protein
MTVAVLTRSGYTVLHNKVIVAHRHRQTFYDSTTSTVSNPRPGTAW